MFLKLLILTLAAYVIIFFSSIMICVLVGLSRWKNFPCGNFEWFNSVLLPPHFKFQIFIVTCTMKLKCHPINAPLIICVRMCYDVRNSETETKSHWNRKWRIHKTMVLITEHKPDNKIIRLLTVSASPRVWLHKKTEVSQCSFIVSPQGCGKRLSLDESLTVHSTTRSKTLIHSKRDVMTLTFKMSHFNFERHF